MSFRVISWIVFELLVGRFHPVRGDMSIDLEANTRPAPLAGAEFSWMLTTTIIPLLLTAQARVVGDGL
jgi:hypothetical protein